MRARPAPAEAISFAVMERFVIRLAFTFDRDFAQYGFTVLTANSW
jgi:predicted nucleic acid-binding protein